MRCTICNHTESYPEARVAVAQAVRQSACDVHFVARAVQRLPLGTTDPAVVRRLSKIDVNLRVRGHPPSSGSTSPASASRWSTC